MKYHGSRYLRASRTGYLSEPVPMAHGVRRPRSQRRVARALEPSTESAAPTRTTAQPSATRTLPTPGRAYRCTPPRKAGPGVRPLLFRALPMALGELTDVSCVDEADCVGVGLDGNNEPISTSSHAAVVPTVSSVAPTVASVAPQRGLTSSGGRRPARGSCWRGDAASAVGQHTGTGLPSAPDLVDPETTSGYPAFRLG